MIAIGKSAGQRAVPAGSAGVAAVTVRSPRPRRSWGSRRLHGQRMQIRNGCGGVDALDVRDVVTRQVTGTPERPRHLQEPEAHQVRTEWNAQVDDPLWHLEIRRD